MHWNRSLVSLPHPEPFPPSSLIFDGPEVSHTKPNTHKKAKHTQNQTHTKARELCWQSERLPNFPLNRDLSSILSWQRQRTTHRKNKGEVWEGGDTGDTKTCTPSWCSSTDILLIWSVIALEAQTCFFLRFGTAKENEEPTSRSL